MKPVDLEKAGLPSTTSSSSPRLRIDLAGRGHSKRASLRDSVFHFVVCSFLILIFTWVFVRSNTFYLLTHHLIRHGNLGPLKCYDALSWSPPTLQRHDFGPYVYRRNAAFNLPLDAKELHFLAEGALSHGSFHVSATAPADSTRAIVEVDVYYPSAEAFEDVTTCRLHDGDSWGLGIFSSRWRYPGRRRSLRFHVHLRLPAVQPGAAPLMLGGLRTELPFFSHRFHSLAEAAYFELVSMQADGMPISVAGSLAADRIAVATKNAEISGAFDAASQLSLETENAPISVHATLLNGLHGWRHTTAHFQTSNAPLYSALQLYSNHSAGTGGAFRVSAHTTHGPLTIAVASAPLDAHLALDARTAGAPAEVSLPSAYEGTFALRTSRFHTPEVRSRDPHPLDPAGRGRAFVLGERAIGGGEVVGSVVWGDEEDPEGRGEVKVETSGSRVRLKLAEQHSS